MSLLEKIVDKLPENFSIDDIAEKAGMTAEEAKKGGEELIAKLRDGSREAAAEAGVDAEKLKGLLSALAEKAGLDGEGSLMEKLTGTDGLFGIATSYLDRDRDGNPINDLTNMAKGFFKK